MQNKQVCRLCLVQTRIYSCLLGEEIKMFEALTSIKVTNVDVPNVVCVKCRLNLKLAYNIQQSIIAAHRSLGKRVIKQEVEEITIKKEKVDYVVQMCDSRCIICGANVALINNHMEQHFKESQHCDLCRETFADMLSYKKHLFKHPETDLNQCKNCDIFFRYKSFYKLHMDSFHQKKATKAPQLVHKKEIEVPQNESLVCKICSKINSTKMKHYQHMISHRKVTCHICNKVLAKGSIRQHVESHSDGPQICECCGSVLKNKSCLRIHMRYSHNKETFSCEECGKVFKKKISLHYHQVTHGEPKCVCDICGKKFFSIVRLNIHKKLTHMNLKPFVCEFCKKAFSRRYTLNTHRRQHTNETPYRCDVCGEGFRQNVSLKSHKKSKHNIKELKTCECKECGKGFASDWALMVHSRLHQ